MQPYNNCDVGWLVGWKFAGKYVYIYNIVSI